MFIFLIFSSTFKFQYFISTAATTPHEFLITDDFNLHTDNHSNLLSQQFPSLINNANLIQHVNFSTHQAGHTLDLVITAKDFTLLPTITRSLISPSDRFLFFTSLVKSPLSPPPLTEYFFCCIKSINLNFICDIWNFATLLCYQIWQIKTKSGTQSTNYYTELSNLHLQHFSKFTTFDLQFYLAPPFFQHICLQLSNLMSYSFTILQPLPKFPHSYQNISCDLDPIPTSLLK